MLLVIARTLKAQRDNFRVITEGPSKTLEKCKERILIILWAIATNPKLWCKAVASISGSVYTKTVMYKVPEILTHCLWIVMLKMVDLLTSTYKKHYRIVSGYYFLRGKFTIVKWNAEKCIAELLENDIHLSNIFSFQYAFSMPAWIGVYHGHSALQAQSVALVYSLQTAIYL